MDEETRAAWKLLFQKFAKMEASEKGTPDVYKDDSCPDKKCPSCLKTFRGPYYCCSSECARIYQSGH